MASVEYTGPLRLGESRYASTSSRPAVSRNDSSTIATQNQINANIAKEGLKSGVQLALEQDHALQKEVRNQVVQLGKSATTIDHARQLLMLLRDRIQKENPATDNVSLGALGTLWDEMEQLHGAFQKAQVVLPIIVDKQKDNIGLMVNSMVHEARQETRAQEKIQSKQLEQQNNLILGQNQAYQEYRARTDSKLEELRALREHVARLTSDNNILRMQLDRGMDAQDNANGHLQKHVSMEASGGDLLSDAQTTALKETVQEPHNKVKSAQQKMPDHEKEILRLLSECEKAIKKIQALEGTVKALRIGHCDKEAVVTKLKTNFDSLNDKYKSQRIEHSKVSLDLENANTKVTSLEADIDTLRKENKAIVQKVEQASNLWKEITELRHSHAELKKELTTSKTKQNTASADAARWRKDLEVLTVKVKKLKNANDDLQEENNNLMSEKNKAISSHISALTIVRDENKMLRETSETLQREIEALESKLWAVGERKADFERGLARWRDLATKSYEEYKEILPRVNEADALQVENVQLKDQLAKSAGSAAQIDGSGDASYWRAKYEELVDSLE